MGALGRRNEGACMKLPVPSAVLAGRLQGLPGRGLPFSRGLFHIYLKYLLFYCGMGWPDDCKT
jgi:hypothetical protein